MGAGIRRRVGWIVAVALVELLVISIATVRLFVRPDTGMPARVDAIVVLGGDGYRVDLGLDLARAGRTRYLVLSRGLPWIQPGLCGLHYYDATVLCFQPDPATTQGEAEYAAQLARQRGWRTLALITTPDQAWRARLRFERCFAGPVYAVTTPLPGSEWPYAIAYQWAATVKAEVFNQGC